MPCLFFEPTAVASSDGGGRLPLIDEWEGKCRADPARLPVPSHLRLLTCNQGYTGSRCARGAASRSAALRYSVVGRQGDVLELVCIEERDYTPVVWGRVRYRIGADCLEAPEPDELRALQALAFCRSYLRRCQV